MYNLRGGFLVRPLAIVVVLGGAGALFSWLEEEFPVVSTWVPKVLFPSHSDPQIAQAILSDIATSTMTVVSIVFAILLMTLTLASMQFSPRIIVSFSRDRVTQWTLGIFLGTFSYCMAALPTARSLPHPFAPVGTVLGAMVLALCCVGLLLFFIHHISQAISVNNIVDRIAAETDAMIDEVMPWPHHPERPDRVEPLRPNPTEAPILSSTSGYIRFVDKNQLVAVAKHSHVTVRVLRRVGHFVPAGVPLMMVSKANRLSETATEELLAAFDLGPTRTLQQDIEFGVLQIVDVALRAISPAVNDPTTAINCVDQLSRILIRFASRQAPDDLLYDPPGIVRASIELDALRPPAGGGLRADPHLFQKRHGREFAAAARVERHCRHDRRSGIPPHPCGTGLANGRRLRRTLQRRRDAGAGGASGGAAEFEHGVAIRRGRPSAVSSRIVTGCLTKSPRDVRAQWSPSSTIPRPTVRRAASG